MNPLYAAYRLMGSAAGILLEPVLKHFNRHKTKELARLDQRLGRYPRTFRERLPGKPRIWLHAVSVGEVGVAHAMVHVLESLLPQYGIVLSTATRQGLVRAETLLHGRATCCYAPLDIHQSVMQAFQTIQPEILVILETEFWPNLIVHARRMGIKTALLNGRISVRSIKGYRLLRPLMRYTLSHLDLFSMISTDDAHRIRTLGADPSKVLVNGNAKFDCPDPMTQQGRASRWAGDLYGITPQTPLFIAGSTREPEEQSVLDAFLSIRRQFPDTVLLIAPRHVERTDTIEQWVSDKGLTCQRRTLLGPGKQKRMAPVVILDTIGELSESYSIADFVFCGGSLVAKGGQNLLEPALWARPIMYGPSMEDFADALRLIEHNGGGVRIADSEQMAAVALSWLRHPERGRAVGRAARQAILAHRGSAKAHVEALVRLIAAR